VAQYKDVELTNGMTVRVHRSPTQRVLAMVEAKDPKPTVPIYTEINVTGREVSMPIPDDPAYLKALNEWNARQQQREDEINMLEALYEFPDLEVPEDWDVDKEVGEVARFYDPDWTPRTGKMGRKLDYIQWHILGDSMDAYSVQAARAELSGIDIAEVNAITASFRDQVEGETD
jgi:hypothetical protein